MTFFKLNRNGDKMSLNQKLDEMGDYKLIPLGIIVLFLQMFPFLVNMGILSSWCWFIPLPIYIAIILWRCLYLDGIIK